MTTSSRALARRMFSKVPEITIFFWIIKVMATTVGETAADFFGVNLHFGLTGTSWVMGAVLMMVLLLQLSARRYIPWIYWLTVVLLSVFGTLITDNMVDNFGVSLQTTTALFGAALSGTFAVWYATERSLSIHGIVTRRRELFYWAAILFTFALGTAAGDLVAEGLQLGYAVSLLVFAAAIAAVTIAHFAFRFNAIAAFWIAYILTRPLGASCGDWLSRSPSDGGLGLGTVGTSALFLATILALVVYLTVSRTDRAPRSPGSHSANA